MKLSFLGAAAQVTGSCFLLETERSRILIDCGMFQGSNFNEGKNHDDFPFDPKTINAIFVTHAHIDHCGRIPKLVHDGFRGKIYATKGTIELMKIVWNDALKVMKYNQRDFGMPRLFHEADVTMAISQCRGVKYGQSIHDEDAGVHVMFYDAGHIFGAAFLKIEADGKRIVFSGDIGNENAPILRDTQKIGKQVDVLIIESTYGDRLHESTDERERIIREHIEHAIERGGTLMIPAFTIERTQELLYELNELIEQKKALPEVPIFLDSPMAIAALPVYRRHPEYYDKEAEHLKKAGDDFFKFPGLRLTASASESRSINNVRGPKIIIAGSGMMCGGRIMHHAQRYLDNPRNTVLIIGFCAEGTTGRKLREGAEYVVIHNKKIPVKARVETIDALSAHGDQKKLLWWADTVEGAPASVYITHGEPNAATTLAEHLYNKFEGKSEVVVPEEGEIAKL